MSFDLEEVNIPTGLLNGALVVVCQIGVEGVKWFAVFGECLVLTVLDPVLTLNPFKTFFCPAKLIFMLLG
jgi:hypothetical protein